MNKETAGDSDGDLRLDESRGGGEPLCGMMIPLNSRRLSETASCGYGITNVKIGRYLWQQIEGKLSASRREALHTLVLLQG